MRTLKILILLFGFSTSVSASPYYDLHGSTQTGTATMNLSGIFNVAASTITSSTPTIIVNGTVPSITISNGATVSTMTPTGFAGGGAGLLNLTGANVVGPVATSTSIAAGALGQIPYQTAAGVTKFLPAIGAAGIISGSASSTIPSTGTLSGTASQVSVTQTGANFVLAGAGQNLGPCGAAQYAGGATWNGGIQTGGVCTTAGIGDVTQIGNNNFSGNNNHSGTETFTGTSSNIPIRVSSGDVTQVSTMTIIVPITSSTTYRLDFDCFYSSAAFYVAVVNGDSGNNYYTMDTADTAGGTSGFTGGTGHGILLQRSDQTSIINTDLHGSLWFQTAYGSVSNSLTRFWGNSIYFDAANGAAVAPDYVRISAKYTSTSPASISKIQIIGSSITPVGQNYNLNMPVSCHAELWQVSANHVP